ncbi:hypothetical protein POM88_033644 [Heracleum sosnowskyi]|uniref:Late embryogenesis abundant protein LEA-2 subgroup domain-containing protein n=1 Tax=Heracleum sosnowskyi TaxID=360622 RepID=A0AAD8HHS1_9APIA|nr:hypothetical protein POM88_033644 [Heracleum sosnowskyi]
MANYEQERPLAPEGHRISIHRDDNDKKHYGHSCLKCCGCALVVFGIVGMTMLILMLTVFKVKDPTMKLNYVTLKGLESANLFNLLPSTNITIEADMSIKNPNAAAFKFKNAVTAGEMPVSTRSSIQGKVEVLNIIKKTVGVKLDCSLTVVLASQNFKDLNCKRSVSI